MLYLGRAAAAHARAASLALYFKREGRAARWRPHSCLVAGMWARGAAPRRGNEEPNTFVRAVFVLRARGLPGLLLLFGEERGGERGSSADERVFFKNVKKFWSQSCLSCLLIFCLSWSQQHAPFPWLLYCSRPHTYSPMRREPFWRADC